MNTTMTLIQNANNLGIDISELIIYMSIVLKNTEMEPDQIVKDFSQLFERIITIWANDDCEDWNNVKAIFNKHEVELVDKAGNIKPFYRFLAVRLYTYDLLSTFGKAELLTALAGEEYRNILLALFENYSKGTDAKAVEVMATTMLEDVYDNQNGGISNE